MTRSRTSRPDHPVRPTTRPRGLVAGLYIAAGTVVLLATAIGVAAVGAQPDDRFDGDRTGVVPLVPPGCYDPRVKRPPWLSPERSVTCRLHAITRSPGEPHATSRPVHRLGLAPTLRTTPSPRSAPSPTESRSPDKGVGTP
jgi:hypothetical protein